jgi:hypothetical protein
VLSRDGHGRDPLQKLARHYNALVTERERSGAGNGVAPAVIPCDQEWASLLVIASSPTRSKCDAFQARTAMTINSCDSGATGMAPEEMATCGRRIEPSAVDVVSSIQSSDGQHRLIGFR